MNLLSPKTCELVNVGSKDMTGLLTRKPFIRCNAHIPAVHIDTPIKIEYGTGWEVLHTVQTLKKFPLHQEMVCLECAGNSRNRLPYKVEGLQWDNRAVSNLIWGGVLLRDVLDPQHIAKGTAELVFTSHDNHFARSLPIEEIYKRPVMIATTMNSGSLPPEHGFPMRLVVPGWYGMASVKWLKEIRCVKEPFEGEYQTEKYTYKDKDGNKTPVREILAKSIITSVEVQNPVKVVGRAWSGFDKVERVEVCVDGKWQDAKVTQRFGHYGWVGWEADLELSPGLHTIASRTTDAQGNTQPDEYSYNFYGYGNNAVQSIQISVI